MPDFKFIDSICKEYNVWVCNDKIVNYCPCRFKLNSVNFCNFPKYIVELSQEKGSPRFNRFLNGICKELKQRVQGTDLNSLEIRHRLDKAVKNMENGEIKPGDIVYCSNIGKNVIFLEYPERKFFETYYKDGVFPGKAKYKTIEGEIGTAPVACFFKISKGNYKAEHVINGKEEEIKRYIDHLMGLCKQEGFRVELEETKTGYKLKILGDSQESVNDFVKLHCHNNLISIKKTLNDFKKALKNL